MAAGPVPEHFADEPLITLVSAPNRECSTLWVVSDPSTGIDLLGRLLPTEALAVVRAISGAPLRRSALEIDMAGSVLTLIAGSSSLNFALFDAVPSGPIMRGAIVDIDAETKLTVQGRAAEPLERKRRFKGTLIASELHDLLQLTNSPAGQSGLAAMSHRVVPGSPDHFAATAATPELMAALEALTSLDPPHRPRNLSPIHTVVESRAELAQDCVIIVHHGVGASLCALLGGVSIATTLAFRVLDGLVMATRRGTINAGTDCIRAPQCRIAVRVSSADEEPMIAHHMREVAHGQG